MVTAKIRVVVEDPVVAGRYDFVPERIKTEDEPFFLDGPIAKRVAVIDRQAHTGLFEPVKWDAKRGQFAEDDDPLSVASIALTAFGIVLETLGMFERESVLGHKVNWAFDSPQLFIVPRAGDWPNAFYDRFSQSLQFYHFEADSGTTVYTALSRDIISHETAHAVLDGLAPALYDALSPQSLAFHESIADLSAVVMSMASKQVREWLISRNKGSLTGSTPVSRLAEEFGDALFNRPLRDANNDKTIHNTGHEPHELSEVLTGAIWKALLVFLEAARNTALEKDSNEQVAVARAMGIGSRQLPTIMFRALDYIPPAEVTFLDYARAIIRADEVVYKDDSSHFRQALKDEFRKRGIAGSDSEFECEPEVDAISTSPDDLLNSEWAAYEFAGRNRKLLGVPHETPFRLFPRREVHRKYHVEGGPIVRPEVVFQLTWEEQEPNPGAPGDTRAIFKGTTLVVGKDQNSDGRWPVVSCLTSSDGQREARDESVRRLAETGQLQFLSSGDRQAARPFAPAAFGRVMNNVLRVRGTGRLLHMSPPI